MKINVTQDLWQRLRAETRPIVFYGMGDGAEKIYKICEEKEIPIAGVFSTTVVKRKKFLHWTVSTIEELEELYGSDLVVLSAFGTAKPDVMAEIGEIAKRHRLYIPDVPVAGDDCFSLEYYNNNEANFGRAYDLLGDDQSKVLYQSLIQYKLSGEKELLDDNTVSREEMFRELFSWGRGEVFVDAGAYRGDTIEEFINMVKGDYRKIFGVEPSGKNFLRLTENLKTYPNIEAVEGAAWSCEGSLYFQNRSGRSGRLETGAPNTRAVAIDDIVGQNPVSYIKFDVEGAELEALKGSSKTIENNYPKLLVSAYHRREDLFCLLLYINEIAPDYSFYLRRNPGYPAWDINLICIKEK